MYISFFEGGISLSESKPKPYGGEQGMGPVKGEFWAAEWELIEENKTGATRR